MAVSSSAEAARGTSSSGVAAEPADGLHPMMVMAKATNSMMATGNETAPTAVLANQAEEERYEAWHLTGICNLYTRGRRDDPRGCVGSSPRGWDIGCGSNCSVVTGKGRFFLNYIIVINLNTLEVTIIPITFFRIRLNTGLTIQKRHRESLASKK